MSQTKKTSKNSVKNRSNKMSFGDFMKRGFRNLGKEYKVWLDGDEQTAASPAPTNRMRSRMYSFVMVVIFIFIIWIAYNLIKTAVIESKDYQLLAENQQLQSISVMANRGSIYDINGNVLAQSSTVYTIHVDPNTIRSHDLDHLTKVLDQRYKDSLKNNTTFEEGTLDAMQFLVTSLSEITGAPADVVQKRCMEQDRSYMVIATECEKIVAQKINDFKVEYNVWGISTTPAPQRIYPQRDLASNVIGHMGHVDISDTETVFKGIVGVESYYDEYLTGIDGRIVTAKDAYGQEMLYRYKQSYDAQDGDSLYLNLDINIQYYLEKALEKACDANNVAQRGCAIIMNCNTGAVMAMATENDYDLNAPSEFTDPDVREQLALLSGSEYDEAASAAWAQQWRNKAISELYYPGSVFKVITGSAALEEKVINLEEQFPCGCYITVNGQKFNCWTKAGHGEQNFTVSMTNSCNPAFVTIGQRLGIQSFFKYFKAFGLTEKTGIDLPGEISSLYHEGDKMSVIDLAACSFGQSNKVTPIEMITAYAAVINGGYLVTPYVVDRIEDSSGNIVLQNEPVIKRQVISEETSAIMREVLEDVVSTNNGSNAYIKGYKIGGKSGTSQKLDVDPEGNTYVSSYVAFAPADDPEIIMLVMIDEPTAGDYYGSRVAAPVVQETLSEVLPYLGYFPEYTDEEIAQLEKSIPDLVNYSVDKSVATITNLGLTYEIVGSGDTVVRQVPSSGNQLPIGSKVILYTEEDAEVEWVTVPSIRGMTLSQANQTLTNAGLNLKPLGGAVYKTGAVATVQNYVEVDVEKGTIIEAYFYVNDETG